MFGGAKMSKNHDLEFTLNELWNANREFYEILKTSDSIDSARKRIYEYLASLENKIYFEEIDLHPLEIINMKSCIKVFKNIMAPKNEKLSKFSALETLWNLANGNIDELETNISIGFLEEFKHLLKGIIGNSGIYNSKEVPEFLKLKGREAAIERSKELDRIYEYANRFMKKYPSGLLEEVKSKREENKRRILDYFGGNEEDWENWKWHLKNIVKDRQTLENLIELTEEEKRAIELAVENSIPFGISAIENAVEWFKNHESMKEVLITGGDPVVLNDDFLDKLLSEFSGINHIERIRIGTRMPVVLPQRITDDFADMLENHHEPGKREVAISTHVEHVYEVTDDLKDAVQKIRKRGICVYNQQVFTVENSRKFETSALRVALRLIGVVPYYTFNTKGKEETAKYRVPIARLMQENKEESRLLPGYNRTDSPVFNVPKLGKNNLISWQDHELISILPDGSRVYEFHPWEKNMTLTNTYIYKDVPIYDYLMELKRRGEDINEYNTIWYYF